MAAMPGLHLPGIIFILAIVSNAWAQDAFDFKTESCCCGNVFPGKDRGTQCCGGHPYDPKSSICCKGIIYPGLPEKKGRCCDNQAYNFHISTCCEGRVVPSKRGQDRCCGYKPYNPKNEMCCNGEVIEGKMEWKCCGKAAYDPENEVCCNGEVWEKTGPYSPCCVNEPFNPEEQVCCSGELKANPVESCGLLCHPSKTSVIACQKDRLHSGVPNMKLQCDTGSIQIVSAIWGRTESDSKQCPAGVKHDNNVRCARDMSRRVRKECEGRTECSLEPTTDQFGDPCSGTYKYLEVEYDCMPDEVTNPDYPSIAYNPLNQIVCCGNLISGITVKPDTSCCGQDVYNYYSQLCCDNTIFELDPESFGCCGGTFYNKTSHTCCAGNVVEGVGQCCGDQVFDPHCEVCCNGQVVHGSLCSGCCYDSEGKAKSYCPKHQICCDGHVYTYKPGRQCCGKRFINVANQMCCNGVIVKKGVAREVGQCIDENSPLASESSPSENPSEPVSDIIDPDTGLPIGPPAPGPPCECPAVKRSITCQGTDMAINCPAGKFVNITRASYGRSEPGSVICPFSGQQNDNTNCRMDVTSILGGFCDSNSCSMTVSSNTLGEPCEETFKYLETEYICQDAA